MGFVLSLGSKLADELLADLKSVIYECGPSCQCPSNCRNRVSQSGLKFRLEVFRTKNKGWGLRSWDSIRAGTFLCEYAGEVVDSAFQFSDRALGHLPWS